MKNVAVLKHVNHFLWVQAPIVEGIIYATKW